MTDSQARRILVMTGLMALILLLGGTLCVLDFLFSSPTMPASLHLRYKQSRTMLDTHSPAYHGLEQMLVAAARQGTLDPNSYTYSSDVIVFHSSQFLFKIEGGRYYCINFRTYLGMPIQKCGELTDAQSAQLLQLLDQHVRRCAETP